MSVFVDVAGEVGVLFEFLIPVALFQMEVFRVYGSSMNNSPSYGVSKWPITASPSRSVPYVKQFYYAFQ